MNLPNKLSIFRILLVPILAAVCLMPNDVFPTLSIFGVVYSWQNLIALIIFVVASVTDFIDGYLARKYELITSFGKFIDPIADKLLINTMFIMLSIAGDVPILAVLIMIWRDILVDGMRMMAAQKGLVIAAHMSGKLKTVFQMLSIILVLLNLNIGVLVVWIASFISIYSAIEYFIATKTIIMESK